MIRRATGLALAALALIGPARAEDLILALSTREVAITSTYTGAEITVFGLEFMIFLRHDGNLLALLVADGAE